MTRNIFIAAVFSLITAVMLGFIFVRESNRIPTAAAAISAERLERGARDYEQYCASCHGMAGQGGVNAGAPALNNIASRYFTPQNGQVPFEAQNGIKEKYGTLRNYVEATLYSGVRNAAMPAFGAQGILRQDQIENIAAYVLSWNSNVPQGAQIAANLEATRLAPTPDPNANPVDAAGVVFQTNCASCHLMTSQKLVGPGLGGLFQPEGTAAYGTKLPNGKDVNKEDLFEWLRLGSAGFQQFIDPQDGQQYPRAMPPFPNLSDDQLNQLYIWLAVHDREGNLTEQGQQIKDGSLDPSALDGGAAAPESTAEPDTTAQPEATATP